MRTLWEIIKLFFILASLTLVVAISLGICGIVFLILTFNKEEFERSLACHNYCREALYTSELSAIVKDRATNKPISGASVTIRESPFQRYQACWNHLLPTTLITNEDGIFRYSDMSFPDLYMIEIMIQSENCTSLLSYRRAPELDGGGYFVGETFLLNCQ